MASVQELLLAAQAQKSPFQALLEGATQGFGQGMGESLDRAKSLIALEEQKIARERAVEEDKRIRAQIAQAQEQKTQGALKKVGGSGTPAHPATRLKEKIEKGKDGLYRSEIEIVQPEVKTPTSLDAILAEKVSSGEMTLEQALEKRARGQGAGGKMLPPATVLAINEGKNVARLLPEVEAALGQNEGLFGPVKGRIGSANPYDEQAQTVDAQMRTASQAFGKYMEGGVLRKEDEEKYRKMFPQLSDTPQVAKNKLAVVRRMLTAKFEDDRKTVGASGYDVSGFEALKVAPSIFEEKKEPEGPPPSLPKPGTTFQSGRFKVTVR